MQPERFVTCGLVLRETVTRDADKILTVLTLDRGRLSVIARGARRKGSRVAAACQLLAYSEMTLYERGRWTMLDAADTIELFDGLRQDLTALSLAAYFAELTEAVSDGSGGDVLPLLLNALYAVRKRLAGKQNLPAFMVFNDATLREMAEKKPMSIDELLNISGVVERKAARYGTTFLRIIEDAVENRE